MVSGAAAPVFMQGFRRMPARTPAWQAGGSLHGSIGDAPDRRRLPNQKIEAGGAGERPEIAVSRQKRNPAIDTTLGDQGIAEARLAALRQHFRP
jgi:hypothetical protein